jgi:hypothetical protein
MPQLIGTRESATRLGKLSPCLLATTIIKLYSRPYNCHVCELAIKSARIICLDCDDTEYTNFCCYTSKCMDSATTKRRNVAHSTLHMLLRTREELLIRDFKTVKSRAQHRCEAASKQYGMAGQTDDNEIKGPRCMDCHSLVSAPCWYCVDCIRECDQLPLKLYITYHF